MRLTGTVKPSIEKLKKLRAAVSGTELSDKVMKKWMKIVATALYDRFKRFSAGAGNWPAVYEIKKGKRRKKAKILQVTKTLLNVLHPTNPGPGHLRRIDKWKIEIGYGGSAKHPGGKISISNLARVHNFGEGFMKKRQIIVQPSADTVAKMYEVLDSELKRYTQ